MTVPMVTMEEEDSLGVEADEPGPEPPASALRKLDDWEGWDKLVVERFGGEAGRGDWTVGRTDAGIVVAVVEVVSKAPVIEAMEPALGNARAVLDDRGAEIGRKELGFAGGLGGGGGATLIGGGAGGITAWDTAGACLSSCVACGGEGFEIAGVGVLGIGACVAGGGCTGGPGSPPWMILNCSFFFARLGGLVLSCSYFTS